MMRVCLLILLSLFIFGSNSFAENSCTFNYTVVGERSDISQYIQNLLPNQGPELLYLTFAHWDKNSKTWLEDNRVDEFNTGRWQKFTAGGRLDLLNKLYYANTRTVSESGLRHAGCFAGDAVEVAKQLLDCSSISIKKNGGAKTPSEVADMKIKISGNHQMMGIRYSMSTGESRFFRMTSCSAAGKGPLIEMKTRTPATAGMTGHKASWSFNDKEIARTVAQDQSQNPGFVNNDQLTQLNGHSQDFVSKLPSFELKHDYQNAAAAAGHEDMPWRKLGTLDLTNSDDATKLSLALQTYVYDGMFNQDPTDRENGFNPMKNTKRYWCHMPWLNQGPNGREAIHGLTQERMLNPSKNIYPTVPKGKDGGNDLGIGIYNSWGCKTIANIFLDQTGNIADKPDFTKSVFEDGTVSAKILFTTANFPLLNVGPDAQKNYYENLSPSIDKGAMTWWANAADVFSTSRYLRPVHHIQMDVAIKDSQITSKGNWGNASNWMMLTYYYDGTYESPLRQTLPGLPEGLYHMRPMGLQAGFDTATILPGSFSNQNNGKLNGPADNPASSCVSCHATAGVQSIPMAPGIMDATTWDGVKASSLDFSQQVNLAASNYQTQSK